MQIQVNTDKNIEGGERLTEYVTSVLEAKLHHFSSQITRVEAHLSDENGQKSHGNDKKCLLEARPSGLQPVVSTHTAATLDQAIGGATEKLERMLNNTLTQLHDTKGPAAPDLA